MLAESRPYPGWVYSARKGFDSGRLAVISRALLDLGRGGPDAAPILEAAHFTGIIPATDADYDSIRDLESRIAQE